MTLAVEAGVVEILELVEGNAIASNDDVMGSRKRGINIFRRYWE